MELAFEQYRRIAGNCLRRAGDEVDPGRRAIYMTIAQACNTLAARADKAQPHKFGKADGDTRLH